MGVIGEITVIQVVLNEKQLVMKTASALPILFMVVAGLGCSEISSIEEAHIVVYVHWGETPLQRKIEMLETREVQETNERGMAEFKVPPGNYTVRSYNINRGGPCCGHVDENVTVKANETKKLDVIDCLPCV